MNDSIVVLDKNLNPRWNQVSIGLSAATGATAPQPAERYAEPPKSPKMEAWEKENGTMFEWQESTSRFLASTTDPNDKNQKAWYQASPDGFISYIGASPEGFMDEEDLHADE